MPGMCDLSSFSFKGLLLALLKVRDPAKETLKWETEIESRKIRKQPEYGILFIFVNKYLSKMCQNSVKKTLQ